jgi:protein-arginine kinase activator protein McsA
LKADQADQISRLKDKETPVPHGAKIATCCYCGTRAALILTGSTRHELTCASCGAPLHDMKMFPSAQCTKSPAATQPRRSVTAVPMRVKDRKVKHVARRKKAKKKSSLGRKFLKEALDALEDIFD